MEQQTRQIKQWKKDKVSDVAKLMDEYKIIGVINMQNLPAKQLQRMREQLRTDVDLLMTRKRLIKLALKDAKKKDIAKLEEHMKGMPALLFSNENPFRLFAILKKNKSKAPIKGGQEAPNDILVPAGPTSFPPGPIIGELGAFGIKTAVEEGKIAIKEDCVVAKTGDVIDNKLAGLLTRLNIEPMEVGLDLVAVYEEGEILTKDVLDVDESEYIEKFKNAARWAFNLALEAAFPTDDNTKLLLSKSHSDALALARAQDILTDATVKDVVAKANAQATSLKSKFNIPDVAEATETKEETKEVKKEEMKEETTETSEEKAEEKIEEKKEEVAEEAKKEAAADAEKENQEEKKE